MRPRDSAIGAGSWDNAAVQVLDVIALRPGEQDDLELLLVSRNPSVMTFTVPPGTAADVVTLTDEEGAPLAALTVQQANTIGARLLVSGPVQVLGTRGARPFERLYHPLEPGRGRQLVVPTVAPLSEADIAEIAAAAREQHPNRIVLAALVGAGTPRGASAIGLIRATVAAARLLSDLQEPHGAPRPDPESWPDSESRPDPEPRPSAAAPAVQVVAVPLTGAGSLPANSRRVVAALAAYAPGGSTLLQPQYRGPLPAPVRQAVELDRPSGAARGLVILLTGLSGSGKSTIARGLHNALIESGARAVTLLDGDVVRRHLSAGLGFSAADRETNVRRIGWVAAEIARHGGIAIASPIAPFATTRAEVRAMAAESGAEYLLIHVATPLAECERRDRKGLYARARRGEIAEFTGISSPYEEPNDADLAIDTTAIGEVEAVALVLAELRRRGVGIGAGTVINYDEVRGT